MKRKKLKTTKEKKEVKKKKKMKKKKNRDETVTFLFVRLGRPSTFYAPIHDVAKLDHGNLST